MNWTISCNSNYFLFLQLINRTLMLKEEVTFLMQVRIACLSSEVIADPLMDEHGSVFSARFIT